MASFIYIVSSIQPNTYEYTISFQEGEKTRSPWAQHLKPRKVDGSEEAILKHASPALVDTSGPWQKQQSAYRR
jgi:hypothetical protein